MIINGSLLLLGLSGPHLTSDEAARFRRIQPAGFVLLPRNLVSPHQTRQLTDDLRALSIELPIIALNHDGGPTSPLGALGLTTPTPAALAARGNMGDIADAAAWTGELLRLLGFNFNFSPLLDLDHFPASTPDTPDAPATRGWGRDPQRVIDYAGHFNRWLRKRSIAGCAKHFPAGGRARPVSPEPWPTCPATLADLLREDVIPYTALMPELDAVMSGHAGFPNIDADLPASLSPRIVRRFLRDQLGFDRHLLLTDDLDAPAIARRFSRGQDVKLALEAGNDLALICQRPDTAEEAARSIASLPRSLTEEARERVEAFRRKKLHPPPPWADPPWHARRAALAALTASWIP